MIFRAVGLPGVFVIDPEPRSDSRGFFARTWCRDEFAAHGLDTAVAQTSISVSRRRGTLRGLHFQAQPFEEVKLVRCTRGAVHDVVLDLRRDSQTFLQHFAIELSADNHRGLYIPRGFAHGFQTLMDDTEVLYQMTTPYAPDYARGVRWNDPVFGIQWPILDPVIHERDANYPDFTAAAFA